MNKSSKIGYISLIVGVVLLAIAFSVFGSYAEGSLMLDTFFCLSSLCLSRADIFFPVFVVGYLLLAFSLALLGGNIINSLMRIVFGK